MLKKFFQTATLAFTGFWLLATSRAAVPVRDCFVGPPERQLLVTLGPVKAPADSKLPSCAGLDGLREGAVIHAALQQSAKRPELRRAPGEMCWGYETKLVRGPTRLSEQRSVLAEDREPRSLFEVQGRFSPAEPCPSYYRLALSPLSPIPRGARVEPLRAGSEPWVVRRFISTDPAAGCLPVADDPVQACEDSFEVRSVTLAP
jgi:hypothetical protein